MTNYRYPRTDVSTSVIRRVASNAAVEDTTNLFVALAAEKGPVEEVVPVHSLEEYVNTFGNLTLDAQGLTGLNVRNWLANGGTAYVLRLYDSGTVTYHTAYQYVKENDEAEEEVKTQIDIVAKYPGTYYDRFRVDVTLAYKGAEENYYTVSVRDTLNKNLEVERFYRKSEKDFENLYLNSAYIKSIKITGDLELGKAVKCSAVAATVAEKEQPELIKLFWVGVAKTTETAGIEPLADKYLSDPLVMPIDVILDAAYEYDVKKAMYDYMVEHRTDISLYLDEMVEKVADGKSALEEITDENLANFVSQNSEGEAITNVFIYSQYIVVEEEDSKSYLHDIEVSPTYALSSLIPYNDLHYGIQYPTAGKRRGVLEDVKKINKILTPDEKEELFQAHINYIEADSRGYYFMNQRTHDDSTEESISPLGFINNQRVTQKMVKDIRDIAREYLFEFNDATTLNNLSATLNKYASEWVSNGTLTYALVSVAKDESSEEAVDVVLNIKFKGTIEVISVNIVVE